MKEGSTAFTRNMRAVSTKRPISQLVLTAVRVGDEVGIDGLSLSVRQIVQVVLAHTGGAGPSKRPVVNPTLTFLVWLCYRVGSLAFQSSGAILKKLSTLVLVKC